MKLPTWSGESVTAAICLGVIFIAMFLSGCNLRVKPSPCQQDGGAPTPSLVVLEVEAHQSGQSQITVTWTHIARSHDGFYVFINDGSGFRLLATKEASATFHEDGTVIDQQQYFFGVAAFKGEDVGARVDTSPALLIDDSAYP